MSAALCRLLETACLDAAMYAASDLRRELRAGARPDVLRRHNGQRGIVVEVVSMDRLRVAWGDGAVTEHLTSELCVRRAGAPP